MVVSGGSDQNIIVWSIKNPKERIIGKLTHQRGVTVVRFVNDSTIASCGQDSCLKTWTIKRA